MPLVQKLQGEGGLVKGGHAHIALVVADGRPFGPQTPFCRNISHASVFAAPARAMADAAGRDEGASNGADGTKRRRLQQGGDAASGATGDAAGAPAGAYACAASAHCTSQRVSRSVLAATRGSKRAGARDGCNSSVTHASSLALLVIGFCDALQRADARARARWAGDASALGVAGGVSQEAPAQQAGTAGAHAQTCVEAAMRCNTV